MDALDLTKAPPRGPRDKLLGIYFIPRTIDKIRAELPGGNPGSYFVDNPIGMTAYVLKKLGIDVADLREVVARAKDDTDVAAWIDANADLSAIERLNANVSGVTVGMMPPERRTAFDALYPGARDFPGDMTLFDVMELDDAKLV